MIYGGHLAMSDNKVEGVCQHCEPAYKARSVPGMRRRCLVDSVEESKQFQPFDGIRGFAKKGPERRGDGIYRDLVADVPNS